MVWKRKSKLKEDFVELLRSREAMPIATAVEEWASKNGGVRRNEMSRLLKGKLVSITYALKLVEYILSMGEVNPHHKLYVAFCDYVTANTGQSPFAHTKETLADLILEEKDNLAGGVSIFPRLLTGPFSFLNSGVVCPQEELADAIKWMYIDLGRQFAGKHVELWEAIELTADKIGISHREFTKKASAWLHFDKWTITNVQHQGQTAGMAMALPLKKETFDAYVAGKIIPHEITVDQMKRPSRYLWLAFTAPRPPELNGPETPQTTPMHFALMHQLAAFTKCTGSESKVAPQIVACAPTEQTEYQLTTAGFKRTGTYVPKSDFPVYYREMPWFGSDNLSIIVRSMMSTLCLDSSDSLTPPKPKKKR